mmetsp:Transcript_34317/g.90591  ORF Transcript_34317/g.90591 Transcript_34317/m.90591 type:complete len:554 (+) Transcript_34317:113-1774(+)
MYLKLICRLMLMLSMTQGALSDGSGSADCPCVDPDLPQYFSPTSCSVNVQHNGVKYCYPKDYGASQCRAWDYTLGPDCADASGNVKADAPDWCSAQWCFVDSSCKVATQASVYFPQVNGLLLSYGTCGYTNSFQRVAMAESMRGATLKVHTLNEPPMVYPDRLATHNTTGRGLVWDLYTDIFNSSGVQAVYKDLQPYNGSSWDACVHNVALGFLDLCLGTFWETAERRDIVTFVTPFEADNFYLVVLEPSKADVDLWIVFDPFTGRLWACILAMIVFVATIIYILERAAEGPDHPHFHGENFIEGTTESTYLACIGFWSGGVAHNPVTPGGRMVTLAFGIFLTLVLAGYTANLTSFLSLRHPQTTQDLYDVVEQGGKLCMWSSVYRSFIANHPTLALSVVLVSSTEEAMEKLDAGLCTGVINSKFENDKVLSQVEHCNKFQVGSPVMTLMLSQPVNYEYSRGMSYWMTKKTSEKAELEKTYQPPDNCADYVPIEVSKQMDISDFYGTLLLTLIATIFGLIIRAVRYGYSKYHGQDFNANPNVGGGDSPATEAA